MDRSSLQQLADLRIRDAEVLLNAAQWEAAYYLLGYTIECALKACIAKQFRQDEVPERKLVNSFYTHDLAELLSLSGIKSPLENRPGMQLDVNWAAVRNWNETYRYRLGVTEEAARELYKAVTDAESGVLPWLKKYW